jgi:hypothetical protein
MLNISITGVDGSRVSSWFLRFFWHLLADDGRSFWQRPRKPETWSRIVNFMAYIIPTRLKSGCLKSSCWFLKSGFSCLFEVLFNLFVGFDGVHYVIAVYYQILLRADLKTISFNSWNPNLSKYFLPVLWSKPLGSLQSMVFSIPKNIKTSCIWL